MSLLRGSSVYLAGAIDHIDDPKSWRHKITHSLLLPMGVKVYDPLVKPSWLSEYAKADLSCYIDLMGKLLENKSLNYDDYQMWRGMKEVRQIDLRMAHSADFFIVSLPKKFTVGTLEELGIAAKSKKPILIHMPDGIVSTWLPTQIANEIHEYKVSHFSEWDDIHKYLIGVDEGTIRVDNLRWVFMSYFNDPAVKAAYEVPSYRQARN